MEVTAERNARRRRPGIAARLAVLLALFALPAFAADVVAAPDPPTAPAEARVLRVATSGDYAPFSFTRPPADESAGPELDGFDVELARRFANDRGYRLELVRFRWPDLAGQLAAGSFDIAMSGVTVRPERSIAGRLSVPVAATHAVALSWKGSGATSFQELDQPQRRVAVNAGGHLERVAREVFRRAEIVAIPDNEAVEMAFLDRTFDGVVTDNYEEKEWTASASDVVRLGPLSDDRKACLLPADRTAIAAELDRWLVAREKDGTLAELRRRYFARDILASGNAPAPETARPLAALASAIRERQALMPLVYEAKRRSAMPIEDATQEAVVLDRAVAIVAAEAAAAGEPAPGADAVRALFAALVAMGKDAQQKLADLDARRRPPSLRLPNAGAETAATTGKRRKAKSARKRAAAAPVAGRLPETPDLSTRLRPAIARIGEKIAILVVAMDPVSAGEARRVLANALAADSIRPDRIEAIAAALERATSGR